jgi:FKBP-type peptidyl-prolyl cis-trans isomerase
MRKLVLGLAMVLVLATGCKKDKDCGDDTVAPASEEQALLEYLTANNIVATKHKSNMYYQISTAGSGGSPNACSVILIDYVGKLTNGVTFDSGTNKSFQLGGLISGWIQGIPLIQRGGQIRLFIPPSLGYGNYQNRDIPANSILIFDVTLKDFQ